MIKCLIYLTACSEHLSRSSGAILVRHGSLNKDPHTTLITRIIYNSIGMKPIYIYLYFVCLCTANRPAMVSIQLMPTVQTLGLATCADSSEMVDDMLVTLS